MSIQGPLPPSNVPPTYTPGSSAPLSDYAQATLCSQLSSVTPTLPADLFMNAAQQNTFWFLRMYSDCSMLYFIQSHPSLYPANYAQNFINDFQFIYSQVSTSSTGFDPQLISDLQNFIANPTQFASNFSTIMTNYNDIMLGDPPSPYDPNTAYSFTQFLSPDDMYSFYLIQIGTSLYNAANNLPQNSFWPLTSNTTSLLGSELGQFICSYFVQRDGWGTQALTNDLNNFNTMMNPLITYVSNNYSQIRALNAAFQGGTDPTGTWFDGLAKNLADLGNGTWDFGQSNMPLGTNNTPPPFWDVTTTTTIDWTYTFDPNLAFNDSNLAQYIENWQKNNPSP